MIVQTGGFELRAEYEAAVRALHEEVDRMRRLGAESEQIARAVHACRRNLAQRFKEQTPEPLRSVLYQRTARIYGDPLGPTIDDLRARGKTWDGIISSATRPGDHGATAFAAEFGAAVLTR